MRNPLLLFAGTFFSLTLSVFAQSDLAPRERIRFDADWRFTRDEPASYSEKLEYSNLQPWLLPQTNEFSNYLPQPHTAPDNADWSSIDRVAADFDDSSWQKVNLPHDWAIAGPFSQDLSGDTGKLPWAGIGWYRKTFHLSASDSGRQIFLDVDGAMSCSAIWINGHLAGGWPYGYSSYRVDLTPYVKPGDTNTLAVRLDNRDDSSRWYPGAGIYRHVWLVKTADVHVDHWGVFVTTPRITADSALVNVDVAIANPTGAKQRLEVQAEIYALDDSDHLSATPVASAEPEKFETQPNRQRSTSFILNVPQPRLWSLETPQRYATLVTVRRDGQVIDRYETPFGIRSISVDADHGMRINGRHVRLNGVCMHHDLGALGTAINTRALQRQLEILQSMGVNAIRTSHNPPAPELLDLCDRMGLVVMDETFDCWDRGKRKNDYHRFFANWHEADVRMLIRRDRNHPSVVMWSIGNEIREQDRTDGWKLAARLAGIVREEDRTRPITAGFNARWSGFIGFQTAVDIVGYNYKPDLYPGFHEKHPTIPVMGSETASTISTRGEYFFPVSDDRDAGRADFQVSSYDLYTPRWATTPDTEFEAQDRNPYVLGEFVWTGFDYIGEPTPYNSDVTNLLNYTDPVEKARAQKELDALGKVLVPSRSSYFGIVDLAGFPKDRYYIYQAQWRPDFPMAHILPHWNWPERVGQVTPVHVYTSGDEAELFLNGRSLGRKKRGEFQYRFRWDDVVYEPGELKVVTYKNGQAWAEDVVQTTNAPAKLLLSADRDQLKADGDDLSFVTIKIADDHDRTVPRTHNPVQISVSGPGQLVAVDNGDPTSHDSFVSDKVKAFNGLALAVIRTLPGQTGTVTVKVISDGLEAGTAKLTVK